MYRTHNCGELRASHTATTVTLCGWVQTVRDKGGVVYVDLRDRYGVTQVVAESGVESEDLRDAARALGREFVVRITGRVVERYNKNPGLPTGDIEIRPDEIEVLNAASTPPFTIEEESDGGEELRSQYRYLDLRRGPLQRALAHRYRINRAVRNYLDALGFMDIETPVLIKSTPEGARDFIVPSRMNAGQAYALPQSPQTFKQLLMVSGYDRYYQIVKCFRDEDLRADRQPEFTQIDCEMSFVEQEDILQIFEGLMVHLFREVKGIEWSNAFPRITWDDAMWYYGNDKPDQRFEMRIWNLKTSFNPSPLPATDHLRAPVTYVPAVDEAGFKVFSDAETVLALCVPGAAEWSRKQIDELTEWVKRPQVGMQGLVYIRCSYAQGSKSSVDKFFDAEKLQQIATYCDAQEGDLILILAGGEDRTRKAAGELRLHIGEKLGLRNPESFAPLWVTDFPLLEKDEENNRWAARHHPFTSPKLEHTPWLADMSKYDGIKAAAYDLVLNGTEIGGGSIRIFQRGLQEQMFAALGMSKEEAQEKFGFLLGAFEYGAPPHGGIALGFDRLCALLGGQETIRDYIAFPKNNAGRDVMLDAPSAVETHQLHELGLSLKSDDDNRPEPEVIIIPGPPGTGWPM